MLKCLVFVLYGAIVAILAVATFVEKGKGAAYVSQAVYGAWWFYVLWAVLSVCTLVYMYKVKLHQKISVYLVHLSFVLILVGAITTATTARRGMIYLPLEQVQNSFMDDSDNNQELPFTITLNSFEVDYYSGTSAAADYTSHFTLQDGDSSTQMRVSMNKIASYMGYRFYQSDYDQGGSWLSINRDVYGIPITYCGYILLAISLVWMLVSPKGSFRRIIKQLQLVKTSLVIILFVAPSILLASENTPPQTLTKQQCAALEDLQVVYNNRVMPISTLARDFTLKLTHDDSYGDLSYEQFFWGWMLFPTEWENEPIFEVPMSDRQKFLGLNQYSSYRDMFTSKGIYKLKHYIANTDPKIQSALYKELVKLDEQVQLIAMLRSGAMVKIFPHQDTDGNLAWYSPIDSLPRSMEQGQALFIKKSFDLLMSAYAASSDKDFGELATKMVLYQNKYGVDSILSPSKVSAERWYYRLPVTTFLYRMNLALGLLALMVIVWGKASRYMVRAANISLVGTSAITLVALSVFISLKWYVSGHIPLVNGYDTMVLMGWCGAIVSLLVHRVSALFSSMGVVVVGFSMLVATIGGLNPQITPLMPVLNSPYLTIHVCLIMAAYALFAFTFLAAIVALVCGRSNAQLVHRTTLFSRLLLMLAVVLLALGIFIGAVWANVSWGRYWAWDPKEVWALITMMVYSLPLHTASLSWFRNDKLFHIYLVFAFLTVLMTYFGVNYYLGGIHSYVN